MDVIPNYSGFLFQPTIKLIFPELIWMVKKNTERILGSNLQYCLHAIVLLAVKYLAELTKYVLLVRVICKNTAFEDRQISLVGAEAAQEICLSSQPLFFPNNPHKQDIFV